jgi:putative ABC transport system permease protein
MVLATLAAWALVRFVFESSFTVPWTAFGLLAAAILAVTTLTGLWNSGEVLRRTPLEVLRTE